MNLLSFAGYSLWANLVAFAVSSGLVWAAGTRLSRYLNSITDRTGLGKAFTGMLLLGGLTSLPEVATVSTASYTGNVPLAVNNLLGSIAINVLLLALADSVLGRDALTSIVAGPAALLQGTLNMLVLAVAAGAVIAGDVLVFGVGAWSLALLLLVLAGMWLASTYQHRQPREAVGDDPPGDEPEAASAAPAAEGHEHSLRSLVVRTAAASAVILAAGYVLARNGDLIAGKTGLGSGIVGFVLVGLSTSLPEISSIVSAVRIRAYEMAIGDVLGTNLFNMALIFLADLVYSGAAPVLNTAGPFEGFALMLGIVLTGIYMLGLQERRDRTFLRMGYDSLAVIATFAGGIVALYLIQRG